MNLKLIFPDRIDSWDTRADGSAAVSHAAMMINKGTLELWSELKFEDEYDPEGNASNSRSERGFAYPVLSLSGEHGSLSFPEFFEAAHDECDLLRFDVDGETIYQAHEG